MALDPSYPALAGLAGLLGGAVQGYQGARQDARSRALQNMQTAIALGDKAGAVNAYKSLHQQEPIVSDVEGLFGVKPPKLDTKPFESAVGNYIEQQNKLARAKMQDAAMQQLTALLGHGGRVLTKQEVAPTTRIAPVGPVPLTGSNGPIRQKMAPVTTPGASPDFSFMGLPISFSGDPAVVKMLSEEAKAGGIPFSLPASLPGSSIPEVQKIVDAGIRSTQAAKSLAERTRHDKVDENTATGGLQEKRRHDQESEATAAGGLKERNRHDTASEALASGALSERTRHDRAAEGNASNARTQRALQYDRNSLGKALQDQVVLLNQTGTDEAKKKADKILRLMRKLGLAKSYSDIQKIASEADDLGATPKSGSNFLSLLQDFDQAAKKKYADQQMLEGQP